MNNETVRYRIVRLDFGDYRHPTGHIYDDEDVAMKSVKAMQDYADKICPDPFSCYILEKEYAK